MTNTIAELPAFVLAGPTSVTDNAAVVGGRCYTGDMEPDDLSRRLIDAVNSADLAAVIDLYEEDAVLELPDGSQARGHAAISIFWEGFLESRPHLTLGRQMPSLCQGDLALTTTQVGDDATVEVARRQPDGSWRWILDRPSVRGSQPRA